MIQERAGTAPCLVYNGPTQELVISQPDHIRDFYDRYNESHTKPGNLHLGNPYGFLVPGAAKGQFNQDWSKMRAHFEPPMSFSAISRRAPRFAREIKTWVKNLDAGPVDSQLAFQFVVFRMLTLHLYEDAYDDRMFWRVLELYHLHEKALLASTANTSARRQSPSILNWFSVGPAPAAQRFIREWREFNLNIIALARNGQWTCPIEVVYRAVSAQNDMTEDAFLSTLSEILFMNVDTSSRILSTIFTNLAANATVQNALRLEAQQNEGAGSAYLYRVDTLLHRVLQESMRLCPGLSFSMPEWTVDAKTIGGYHIPAGTAVVMDAGRLNNDPAIWGTDYDKWDPDRFLRASLKDVGAGFVRYGVGPAAERCLGKDAADILFKLLVVAVIQELSLGQTDGEGEIGKMDLTMARL
ncbi:putative cytochrome P450 [Rosellinia necatrix]|uniref:Putative cytochrome P450 n=1 Tax=Rosellinia necatrix TaxID=77044 RepID=A0A1S8AB97_ROSNE|nr:putative cytochrome P450 [Rosellinia necatrix]